MWYGQTGKPTTYTDLLADSINDFELRLQEIVSTVVTNEFNVTEDSSEISENDVQKVIERNLEILRVAFSGDINPNQPIDESYPVSESREWSIMAHSKHVSRVQPLLRYWDYAWEHVMQCEGCLAATSVEKVFHSICTPDQVYINNFDVTLVTTSTARL